MYNTPMATSILETVGRKVVGLLDKSGETYEARYYRLVGFATLGVGAGAISLATATILLISRM